MTVIAALLAAEHDLDSLIRSILRDWNYQKQHEAIIICRVAGINPATPESLRK